MPDASWNDTARAFRSDALIHELVAEAAQRWGDRPALVGSHGVLSHRELDQLSNQIARHLVDLDVPSQSYVAVLGDHIPETIAALLGVVKSGAAYVPLDPRWPNERLISLLSSLHIGSLIVDRAHFKVASEIRWSLPELVHVVCVDSPHEQPWQQNFDRDTVLDLWDWVSDNEDPLQAAGFNRGSVVYTEQDVKAYSEHIAGLVTANLGTSRRVLDVGCGTGLILRELATHVEHYAGIDPSAVAVKKAQEWAADHVHLAQGFAHEVGQHVTGEFDVAVLASTVQFFPGIDYLVEVIESVADQLGEHGTIVLADLIDPALEEHAGLRVPPSLFARLTADNDRFVSADVLRRDDVGLAHELAHRYDVVLRVHNRSERAGVRRDLVTTGWHIGRCATDPVESRIDADSLAYAIFTSGSTGQPKAVAVRHRSVVNLIDWVNRTYEVTSVDRLLMVTSFSFDLSVYDIFGILSAGGSLRLVADRDLGDPDGLAEILETEPITFWDSAPAAMSVLLAFLELRQARGRDSLRLVFLSGDWVPLTMPGRLREQFPSVQVVALGGATECTVWSNHFPVHEVDPDWPSIPYGTPMQNARYYVLDDELRVCPTGVAGDLYIGGVCVAAGYAGDPDLTAKKFRLDPFVSGEQMYRTGDRACWLPDGNVRFLGRLDDQLKVRGYRIELAEVQAALNQCHATVREAAVIAVNGNHGPEIATFYVPVDKADPTDVSAEVGRLLPGYMIPGHFVPVDSLPVSAMGKVDRARLLALFEEL